MPGDVAASIDASFVSTHSESKTMRGPISLRFHSRSTMECPESVA